MTHRAQVVLPNISGLPEDKVVNTFHFVLDPGGIAAARTAINAALVAFYNSGTNPIAAIMSAALSRTASACEIKWYDLADTPPRVPQETYLWTLGAPTANVSLPAEVAVVASFQGVKVSGINQARRRGRVYIGPLTTGASATTASVSARPSTVFIATIIAAMTALKTAATAANSPWSVYSTVNLGPTSVANGWVDNAYDSQRRRGVASTLRTTFGL